MKYNPIPVTKLDMAFGGKAMEILPQWPDIPDEFKQFRNTHVEIFSRWFYKGLPVGTEFVTADGIDKTMALANIRCAMGSFEPKHEHKEAGVAYLLSLWFKEINIPTEETATKA